MNYITDLFSTFSTTLYDVFPIIATIFLFQVFVLREKIPNFKQFVFGFFLVLLGLTFFLEGLDKALFPLGKIMATQLTDPEFLKSLGHSENLDWTSYYLVYLFAAAIGFTTTIAEPSLIAVAIKAKEVSGGTISIWGLKIGRAHV